ncbi:MAG: hypothetical protein Q7J75_01765 [Rhodoferax sp.]|nr:hypothetical protein [Rhodoferax sp.]
MRTDYEQEVMDRIIRIESRIVQLGDHVGANLRVKQKIDISNTADGIHAGIDSLDVSMSRIFSELAIANSTRWPVTVIWRGRQVATLHGPIGGAAGVIASAEPSTQII